MAAAAVAHQHTGNSLNVNVYGTLAAVIIAIGGSGGLDDDDCTLYA